MNQCINCKYIFNVNIRDLTNNSYDWNITGEYDHNTKTLPICTKNPRLTVQPIKTEKYYHTCFSKNKDFKCIDYKPTLGKSIISLLERYNGRNDSGRKTS